jgi:hypothetical protein
MISRFLLGLFIATASGAAAAAQDVMPLVRERIVVPGQSQAAQLQVQPSLVQQRGSEMVRVQVSINLFMPAPASEGDEADKIRDRARRSIYEFAQRECDILRDVLARECRLEAINVNVMRQPGPNVPQGFNVSGQLTLQVALK